VTFVKKNILNLLDPVVYSTTLIRINDQFGSVQTFHLLRTAFVLFTLLLSGFILCFFDYELRVEPTRNVKRW
jgi:hypothetical protein